MIASNHKSKPSKVSGNPIAPWWSQGSSKFQFTESKALVKYTFNNNMSMLFLLNQETTSLIYKGPIKDIPIYNETRLDLPHHWTDNHFKSIG